MGDNESMRAQAAQDGANTLSEIESRERQEWETHLRAADAQIEGTKAATAVDLARAGQIKAVATLVTFLGLPLLILTVLGTVWIVRHW